MIDLSPTDRFCYRLAYAQAVAVPLAEIPAVLQLPEAEAAEVLADLIAGGHVEIWPERRSVVLTPSTAERLGLELVADRRNRLQWHRKGSRAAERRHRAAASVGIIPTPPDCPAVIRECDLRDDDGSAVLDDLPGPTSVELADQGVPRLILGVGMVWPVRHAKGERCKGCRHLAKMPTGSVCLLCHRAGAWNLRAVRPDAGPDDTPAPAAPAQACKRGAETATAPNLQSRRYGSPPALAGGIGRPAKSGRGA